MRRDTSRNLSSLVCHYWLEPEGKKGMSKADLLLRFELTQISKKYSGFNRAELDRIQKFHHVPSAL